MLVSVAIAAGLALTAPDEGRQRLRATDIEHAVRAEMLKRLQAIDSAAEVHVAGRVDDQWLPNGSIEITAGEVAGRFPRSRIGVPVSLQVDGRHVRSLTAWVEIREPRMVMTYSAAYARHHEGASMHWEPASVDMTCCPGDVATSSSQVEDLRVTRAVRPGQPVMLADFESMPEIRAQQRVTIEMVRGPVRLQAEGIALADARVGEVVAVRPDHSTATLDSRAVSINKVVVE
ncbi:MAG: flagellar basal body P-ring formation chaperone FlgA [Pseudomonadota bacterium]|nr:flagellar basal body P-ring formation chaperone FlgA [Pseudomonadota bacterium]